MKKNRQFITLNLLKPAAVSVNSFGESTNTKHRRMWKGNGGILPPQDSRTCASELCAQAAQNYLAKNSQYPYTPQDNPNGKPFEPLDGTYKWSNPIASDCNPSSKVRYIEGPQTRAWINQRDSNYTARIAREEAERVAAEQARIAAEAERQRQAALAVEQARREAEAERQRQEAVAAEQARVAAERERQRQAEIAAEQARVAAEAERQRQAVLLAEQARVAAEVERQRQAELVAEQARVAAERERERQAAVVAEQTRIAAEAECQRQVGEMLETELQCRTEIVETAEREGEVLIAAEHEEAVLAEEEAAINLSDQQNLNAIRDMFAANSLFSQRRGESDHSSTHVQSVASAASF